MGNPNALIALVCLSLYPACVPIDPDPEPPAPIAVSPAPAPAAIPDFAAFTASGDLAIAAGDTGAIRSTAAAGATGERDLAWDPWNGRVLVQQTDEESDGGEIAAYPLADGALGARSHLVWVDGRARLLATPFGPVVFEVGYGQRWKLLGDQPSSSVIAPPPASAWLSIDPEGTLVHALDHGANGDELHLRTALVSSTGISAPLDLPLGLAPATQPPTTRLVPAPARGGAVLLDVAGASLAVRLVHDSSVDPPSLVPLPSPGARIEAAVALAGGEVVALLLSGQTTLLAIDAGGAVSSRAEVPLPGDVAPADRFFSRDLAALSDTRLLAATSAGVHALDVTHPPGSDLALALDATFDGAALRGPICLVSTPP
jgi:hypothetical protein